MIKKKLLSLPRLGVIGFHPASIPQNRGRHPIIWSLVLGLKNISSTFFFMNTKADAGNIITQKGIIIEKIFCDQLAPSISEASSNSMFIL